MIPTKPQLAYPVLAFPPICRDTIQEVAEETKAPIAMVGSSFLAAMALAVQAQYRVRRLEGLESPCSLAVVSICASGERKTTVDKKATKAFYEFEESQKGTSDAKYSIYRGEKIAWDAKLRVLRRKLEKYIENNEPVADLQLEIVEHEQSMPKPPRRVRFIYKDTTPSATLHGLNENSRSAAILEDEAARFFNGSLASDAGLINQSWDGSTLVVDRRNSPCFAVKSPRMTLNLMVQPTAFTQYMERKGEEARGIGFIARWLICWPTSTQGYRLSFQDNPGFSAQAAFSRRITTLLTHQIESGALEDSTTETILTFSPDAQREWINVANEIECMIRPGGPFCEASDYASKVAENIARIAGVFHAFSGNEGTSISFDTLRCAVDLCSWYAQEFIRLFSPPDPLHETTKDAILLEKWLIAIYKSRNWISIQKNFILQYGPNRLRSKQRLNWALNCLCGGGRISGSMQGRTEMVYLNAAFFGPASHGQVPFGFPPLTL